MVLASLLPEPVVRTDQWMALYPSCFSLLFFFSTAAESIQGNDARDTELARYKKVTLNRKMQSFNAFSVFVKNMICMVDGHFLYMQQ